MFLNVIPEFAKHGFFVIPEKKQRSANLAIQSIKYKEAAAINKNRITFPKIFFEMFHKFFYYMNDQAGHFADTQC